MAPMHIKLNNVWFYEMILMLKRQLLQDGFYWRAHML